MFMKLSVFLFLLGFAYECRANHEWDIAVATSDKVVLLTSNGSIVDTAVQEFKKLKALALDSARRQFVVSDMEQLNDTIFTVHLSKEADIKPVVADLPDNIQGLAIDSLRDVLYWTDSEMRRINYVSLNDTEYKINTFLEFDDESPQDLAIDSCRRYIYWTNSDLKKPTIERARLEDKVRTVLVEVDLHMPSGITIDEKAQKIYWADIREGIYSRIESTDLDGNARKIMYNGTYQKPYGVAVDDDSIYWTDLMNNALWRMKKGDLQSTQQIQRFDEKPGRIVVKNFEFSNVPSCDRMLKEIEESQNFTSDEYFDTKSEAPVNKIPVNKIDQVTQIKPATQNIISTSKTQSEISESNVAGNTMTKSKVTGSELALSDEVKMVCLNNGQPTEHGCRCQQGYTGNYCETSLCHNHCFHGDCHFSSKGFPQCNCHEGFSGPRCERNTCESLCLNGGSCNEDKDKEGVSCTCPLGYAGSRCEIHTDLAELCNIFCQTRKTDVLFDKDNTFMCRCEEGSYTLIENNSTNYHDGENFDDRFKDPIFVMLSAFTGILFVCLIFMSVMVCRLRRRPRIKKRIIVNKNVTPLTYRPQPPAEQCEITIENCCNMNVCETPCFEPSTIRTYQTSKKDEKKTLLSNMENGGDDLY